MKMDPSFFRPPETDTLEHGPEYAPRIPSMQQETMYPEKSTSFAEPNYSRNRDEETPTQQRFNYSSPKNFLISSAEFLFKFSLYVLTSCDTSSGRSNHTVYMSTDMMSVADADFSKPLFCGMCLRITGPAGFVYARISGTCNSCSYSDISVSPQVYSAILGSNTEPLNRTIPITWSPCVSL
ncbi:hypothetical protein BB561_004710 [Smittium simulii]|uniref:RlpA-like protein double-psi beta-barrel domain-containing protein n=1 Tax=Smittium simulii TaxID=133385 RepID=A0A2T9YEP4_9FUNG|nr:hypothetical protein BB561_004710 [Smittium simulii]